MCEILFGQGNCQVIFFFYKKIVKAIVKSIVSPQTFFKTTVKSIICPTNVLRKLSSQLCDTKFVSRELSSKFFYSKNKLFFVNYFDF